MRIVTGFGLLILVILIFPGHHGLRHRREITYHAARAFVGAAPLGIDIVQRQAAVKRILWLVLTAQMPEAIQEYLDSVSMTNGFAF